MPQLSKGIAAGIGLISEYRHHQKDREAAKSSITITERAVSDDSVPTVHETNKPRTAHFSGDAKSAEHETIEVIHDDEKQWALDEAQDALIEEAEKMEQTEKPKERTEHDPAKMTKKFTDAHPPSEGFEIEGLSLPVVLPQRRPKDRSRGFIRAYAPELQHSDIDQETFLEFIETFNQAILAAPWLDAINLASLAFVTLPTPISMAAGIAIRMAVDVTKNMQSRHRHSYVLDQMNDDFFRPRGLYALVLTWKPESSHAVVSVNVTETISQNLSKPEGVFEKAKHSFQPSMGKTAGVAFAETAPLVFPVLDSLVNDNTPEAKEFKQMFKNAQSFIGDYLDRRAQAQYAGENPDSQLATQPVFKSRYADPNHPANSGGLIALATGGHVTRAGLLGQRRGLLGGGRHQRRGLLGGGFSRFHDQSSSGYDQPPPMYDQYPDQYAHQNASQYANQNYQRDFGGYGVGNRRQGLIGGGIKRVFQHHVLYLAIVNMPSEEELAAARDILKQAEAQQHNDVY